jgi:hypothetical protein
MAKNEMTLKIDVQNMERVKEEITTLKSKLDDALSLAVKLLDIVSNTDAVYPDELEDMGQELRHIRTRVNHG